MTSSADLARVLRAADDHRDDPAALHRALHLSLLAADELMTPDHTGEMVRAVELALAAHVPSPPVAQQVRSVNGSAAGNGRSDQRRPR